MYCYVLCACRRLICPSYCVAKFRSPTVSWFSEQLVPTNSDNDCVCTLNQVVAVQKKLEYDRCLSLPCSSGRQSCWKPGHQRFGYVRAWVNRRQKAWGPGVGLTCELLRVSRCRMILQGHVVCCLPRPFHLFSSVAISTVYEMWSSQAPYKCIRAWDFYLTRNWRWSILAFFVHT